MCQRRAWVVYDNFDGDRKRGGGTSLKGKPLTSCFTLMYRACRLAIKCTTNIDIFPFSFNNTIMWYAQNYSRSFELYLYPWCSYGIQIEFEVYLLRIWNIENDRLIESFGSKKN